MYRHRLAAVFEPESIVLISDQHINVFEEIPESLSNHAVWLRLDKERSTSERLRKMTIEGRYDLAAVAVSQANLQVVLDLLSACTPKALILLTEDEVLEDPDIARQRVQQWADNHDCLVFGPRSFGVQRPRRRLNLSKLPMANPGRVAVISQSRTIQMAVMDWAHDIKIGISAAISLGEADGVSLAELLEYLAGDNQTDSIVVYLDRLDNGRELVSAMRMAASVKPLIILRSGRHNPALIGDDIVFDAAVRRTGAIRVNYFIELFAVIKTLTHTRRPKGGRLALVGTSRSVAQLLWDVVNLRSGTVQFAEIPEETRNKLIDIFGPGSQADNPIVAYSPLHGERLIQGLEVLTAEKSIDAIVLIIAPDDSGHLPSLVARLAEFAPTAKKPILTTLFGETTMTPLRRVLDKAGTPAFRTPETAFAGIYALTSYHYNQQLLQQIRIPFLSSASRDRDSVKRIVEQARADDRTRLSLEECQTILTAYGIENLQKERFYRDVSEDNFLPLVRIGVARDEVFGPWIYFTESGHTRLMDGDSGLELPPLNAYLAAELIHRSRIWTQELEGKVSEGVFEQIQKCLESVSDLVSNVADIETVVIDPMVITKSSLLIHDVKIKLTDSAQVDPQVNDYQHMAIYPYPSHLIEHQKFKDGTPWTVRPIRPEDAEALQGFIRKLSEHTRYMRFVSMMTELTPKMLSRYTYVDYYKELALVATTRIADPDAPGGESEIIIGFAHYLRNADGVGAEYALVVSDEWQNRGLGRTLMKHLLSEAKDQGLAYIEGYILNNNRPMLNLMTSLGLHNDREPDDPMLRRVWMPFKGEIDDYQV